MKSSVFRFKQFSVAQGNCAMKVNTDGVLLGAWAEVSGAKTILDIGTGTGVIAMIMAQKNEQAIIHAIDIDEPSFIQANENFNTCVWANRLTAFNSSLQNFGLNNVSQKKPLHYAQADSQPLLVYQSKRSRRLLANDEHIFLKSYDCIISNPPYFIDDFKTNSAQKNIAKHHITLNYNELLVGISRLLSATGKAFVEIPIHNVAVFKQIAEAENLFATKHCEVIATEGKTPYLCLLQLERSPREVFKTSLQIMHSDENFTAEYKQLTENFYLKF